MTDRDQSANIIWFDMTNSLAAVFSFPDKKDPSHALFESPPASHIDCVPFNLYNITINISLKKDSLKSNIAGNYEQSIGKYIPIIVYGKVWQPVDRGLDTWELHITPLAVY